MSSLDLPVLRRLGLIALLSLSVAGCFRPVYGSGPVADVTSKNVSADVVELMRSVDVKPAEDRVGLKLRNELLFMLHGGGEAAPTRYTLKITLTKSGRSAIVDPTTNAIDSRTVSMQAEYQLLRAGSLDPVATGHAAGTATFFTSLQRFANVRAERDAEDRAATQIAERIRSRLLSFFAAGT